MPRGRRGSGHGGCRRRRVLTPTAARRALSRMKFRRIPATVAAIHQLVRDAVLHGHEGSFCRPFSMRVSVGALHRDRYRSTKNGAMLLVIGDAMRSAAGPRSGSRDAANARRFTVAAKCCARVIAVASTSSGQRSRRRTGVERSVGFEDVGKHRCRVRCRRDSRCCASSSERSATANRSHFVQPDLERACARRVIGSPQDDGACSQSVTRARSDYRTGKHEQT